MFECLFGRNTALIKENRELRKELMEIRQKELLKTLLSDFANNQCFGGLGGVLGGGFRSPSNPQQRIIRGLDT